MGHQSVLLQANHAETLQEINRGLNDIKSGLQYRKAVFTTNDVDCLQERLQALSISRNVVAKEQSVLQSLAFDSRPVRHAQIARAHEKTFEWALMTNTDGSNGSGLGKWLEQGDGIFWVSGKPGSGKSTLMKFLASSRVTSKLVARWAHPSNFTIASHYFWIAGTPMQKSYQGLLQTLLYDVFRQFPYLIQDTCPDRWASANPRDSWTLTELRVAFQTVSKNTTGRKFCFFIDGLDEYNGGHEEQTQLCRILKDLIKCQNVKLCLSSRPWNVFEEAFGHGSSKLYVQDLTRDDIHRYVQDRLRGHPRWAAVSEKHSQGRWLVSEITAKSNGVFLWVYIVTKLLRQGLTNRDGWFDLQRRLKCFPSELEPFFKTILESVEPFYHSRMATALQIALASEENQLDFLAFYFHGQEYEDVDYAIKLPIRIMLDQDALDIRDSISWQLDSRTKGLLEVHPENGTVNFLHRTARDFLATQEMRDFLAAKVDERLNFSPDLKFSPQLSLIKACLAIIKISRVPLRIERMGFGRYKPANPSTTVRLALDALEFAARLEEKTTQDARHHPLFDELDRTIGTVLTSADCVFSTHDFSGNINKCFFREQLVQLGFFDYLHTKLELQPYFLSRIGSLPLLRFLTPDPKRLPLQKGRGTDVLLYILRNRCIDLNECRNGQASPWVQFLSDICRSRSNAPNSALDILTFVLDQGILLLLLKAGASPNAKIAGPSHSSRDSKTRAAAVFYTEFCFQILEQSPQTKEIYLSVFQEFLWLSTLDTVKAVCGEFVAGLAEKPKAELQPWNLSFLSRFNDLVIQSLNFFGPDAMETKLRQDAMARQMFPPELYTPMAKTESMADGGRKRKDEFRDEGSEENHSKRIRGECTLD